VTLEENGFKGRVEVYNDPSLALGDFKSGSYALLLLEIAMPRMDGFTLYEKIRKIDRNIKEQNTEIDIVTTQRQNE